MIARPTASGGVLQLKDPPDPGHAASCALCRAEDAIGVTVRVGPADAGGPTLDTLICADCICAALAVRMGSQHVRAGGDVTDLELNSPHQWEPDREFCGACGYARLAVEGSHGCSGVQGKLGPFSIART
ncbi:MAG: hypothetical protein WKF96_00210 [Solirubrobacteraceae bacterium]